ncbi:MAG TPA: ribosome maturation factor RimP [Clostridia bacterium]|nr:MAG: Ribosome maturation factor RimP [Firmicutes bacterium ADurb.Bin146]HOD92740.1 ribosome maturation factor RimP [Clostridia bacterium]
MAKSIAKQAFEIASRHAIKWSIEVLDTEFVKEGPDKYLRIYLYKPDGITIDDCEKVHRDIDEEIDMLDIKDAYYLEVSSLGYDKNLKTDREFEIFANSKVNIQLYKPIEKEKNYEGVLINRDQNITVIKIDEKEIIFENKDIAKITRVFEF